MISPVLALYDPFGVDVPLKIDIINQSANTNARTLVNSDLDPFQAYTCNRQAEAAIILQ